MNNSIFREKSVESISSPDSLNDYIRVVSQPVWATLIAVILALIGVTVWGIFGHLDTTVEAVAVSEDGVCTVYFEASNLKAVLGHDVVTIEGNEYHFDPDEMTSGNLTMGNDGEILAFLNKTSDTQVIKFTVKADVTNGLHYAKIVIDSVTPMSFVTN